MSTLNSEAETPTQEGRIIDQEPLPEGTETPKQAKKAPPNLKWPLPPIPAPEVMVPPEMLKMVYLLRRQMEDDPLSVPLEAWVWEKNYTIAHPSKKLGNGGAYRRKGKHKGESDEYEEEYTDPAIEKERKKPKILREVNGLIKIVTKRLDTRELHERTELKDVIKEVTGVVRELGGIIKDLATENRNQTSQRQAYEEQLRKQAEELRKYAEGLPDKHPMKGKIMEALGYGAKLFLPKLIELAKLAGIEVPKMEEKPDDE